jgi:hypothetical protein
MKESKPQSSGVEGRDVGDLLFLWNREGHIEAGRATDAARRWNIPGGLTKVVEATSTKEGCPGVFLEFVQDPKKGKHLWKVLVTLRNGNCVVWTIDAKLFKRGWMGKNDPVPEEMRTT